MSVRSEARGRHGSFQCPVPHIIPQAGVRENGG